MILTMKLNKSEIENLEKRYRGTFINSLSGFKQAVLVGTRSTEGLTNLAIFSSLIHFGANPALFGMVTRPDTVQRDTLKNIVETGFYTFNFVDAKDWEKAHQTSAKYETGDSEFEKVGFQAEVSESFFAPFVQESPIKIGLKFETKIDIILNGTILVIGSLETIELAENLVSADGFVDLEKANVLGCMGLDAYFEPKTLGRLSYAKTDKWPVNI